MALITSLDVLQEPFRSKVRGILSEAMERRIYFIVVETLRDLERQEILVAQGKSKTLKSNHLKGLAVDVVPVTLFDDQKVKSVTWDREYPAWKVLGELAVKWGVTWGGTWTSFPDLPHLEEKA